MSSVNVCAVCSKGGQQLRCSRCHSVYYCTREHQRLDWKKHKVICNNNDVPSVANGDRNSAVTSDILTITQEETADSEIFNSKPELLSPRLDLDFREEKSSTEKLLRCAKSAMPIQGENRVLPPTRNFRDFPEISLRKNNMQEFTDQNRPKADHILDEISRNVIRDMDAYGLCVIDNFLGEQRGKLVLDEVLAMYHSGVFKDGQLVSSTGRQGDQKNIRSDQITWIDGREKFCNHIGFLLSQVDAVVMRANKMVNNGKLGSYNINGRTKVRPLKITVSRCKTST